MQLRQTTAPPTRSMKDAFFEEKKEMEEEVENIDLSIKTINSKLFEKKRKYPFHEKVDINAVDGSIKCLFAETYDIITDILSKIESGKLDELSEDNEDVKVSHQVTDDPLIESDHIDYDDDDDKDDDDDNDDDEKIDVYLEPPTEPKDGKEKYDDDNDEIKEEIVEIMPFPFPLTEAEIRKEMEFESKIEKSANSELNEYQEKLIEIIINEFESIYFRSPSSKEVSIILSKSIEKMKKCEKNRTDKLSKISILKSRNLTKNQQLLASNASKVKYDYFFSSFF